MRWVQAIERDDPDPAGRSVARGERGHAFDVEAGRAVHPILGNYLVKKDISWSDPIPGERCERCIALVGRYPVEDDDVLEP